MAVGQTRTSGVLGRKGLGNSAERVWLALQSGPQNQTTVSQITGLSSDTISRSVSRLEEYSVVVAVKRLVTLNPDTDFARLGADLGTDGIAAKLKAKHEAERQKFRRQSLLGRTRQTGRNPRS
jgi:hypothetical protein